MRLNNKGAQAVTEFVIILPFLLLVFVGIYQLTVLSYRIIQLRMMEREIMMYITSDLEEDKKIGPIREFAEEMAENMGMDKNRLHVKLKAWPGGNDEEKNKHQFAKFGFIKQIVKIGWATIIITYKQKTLPVFAAISGRDYIELKVELFSSKGGSFQITLEKLKDWIGSFVGGGKDW